MKITHNQFVLFIAFSAITMASKAQVNILSGTKVKVLPGTELSTTNIYIDDNGVADIHGTLNLKGDLTANGDLFVDGQLKFSGKSIQSVEGTRPFDAAKMEINNPSGVDFNLIATIHDSLKLVNGKMYINTETPLHFSPTAKNPVESSNSHIVGRAIMNERQVGTQQLSLFLGCGISDGSNIGIVSIDRITGPEGIVKENSSESIASKWKIYTSINPEVDNRDVVFQWLPDFDNGNDVSKIDLYGTDIGGDIYTKLNSQAATLPLTGMRTFIKSRVGRFNREFTLSDDKNPLTEPPVGQKISGIFPNPFFDHINVKFENSKGYPVTVKFISGTGHMAYQATVPSANNMIEIKNLEYLPQGNYWLQIYIHGSVVSTQVMKIR